MRSVIFHPLAEQELLDAVSYYENQETGLGLDYLGEVEHAVDFLVRYPEAGAGVRGDIRRLTLPKGQFKIEVQRGLMHVKRVLGMALRSQEIYEVCD
jgi:toxin ParE1/3/4